MIHLGFTGTRDGLTDEQRDSLADLLIGYAVSGDDVYAHHGDCVGADEEFDSLCRGLDFDVIVHPPLDPKFRAFCGDAMDIMPPLPYMKRNESIVYWSHEMIVCPSATKHVRSGTWATARRARDAGRPMYVVRPDGGVWQYPCLPFRANCDKMSESTKEEK